MNIPTSDPGTTAILTPGCKTHGLYFDDSHEPENFKYIYDKDIYESIARQAGAILANSSFESVEKYFDQFVNNDDTDILSSDMDMNNIHLIEIPSDSDEDDDEMDEYEEDEE